MNNELEQKSIQHFLGFYINSVKKNDPIATHATPMCQIAYPKTKIYNIKSLWIPLQRSKKDEIKSKINQL